MKEEKSQQINNRNTRTIIEYYEQLFDNRFST